MIASTVLACSSAGRLAQTRGAFTRSMVSPPGDRHSLEGQNQFRNGASGKNGWNTTRFVRQVGTGNGNEGELTGDNLDLAVAHMIGQAPKACQLESATEERVTLISHRDVAFAFLLTDRCITLVTVCRSPEAPATARPGAHAGTARWPDQRSASS
jgi:hypothetical protein